MQSICVSCAHNALFTIHHGTQHNNTGGRGADTHRVLFFSVFFFRERNILRAQHSAQVWALLITELMKLLPRWGFKNRQFATLMTYFSKYSNFEPLCRSFCYFCLTSSAVVLVLGVQNHVPFV